MTTVPVPASSLETESPGKQAHFERRGQPVFLQIAQWQLASLPGLGARIQSRMVSWQAIVKAEGTATVGILGLAQAGYRLFHRARVWSQQD